MGGSIYLKDESILDTLLGSHFYQDGTYVYVVDSDRRIIYHPESSRVGDTIKNNEVINAVTQGQSGTSPVLNSKGVQMLAGYATIPSAGWASSPQRPRPQLGAD